MTHPDSGPGPGLSLSLPHSPSFTDYSSGTMADTAARVVSEFDHLDAYGDADDDDDVVVLAEEEEDDEDDDDGDDDVSFEFPVLDTAASSATEILSNGQIRQQFPLFNTDLVFADTDWRVGFNLNDGSADSTRTPLKKLLFCERVSSMADSVSVSCSSSEADDLEGVPPDSYCEWSPSKQEMRRKSRSTGTASLSKRWRFRQLLYRSNSDGADAFAGLSAKQRGVHKGATATGDSAEKAREIRENDLKGLDGPHRRDPVGFFARMNELGRTIQPF